MAVAVYQPASTDCPGDDDPEDENINTTEVCPMDPLADMQIRPTCSGTEGGRYGGRGGTIMVWTCSPKLAPHYIVLREGRY